MTDKNYDPAKLSLVPISSVEANGWNPKNKETKQFRHVVRSLELYGFRQPILVRNHPDDKKKYQILDGEQRFTAAQELDYIEIPVYNLGDVSDEEAKAATIWMEVQVPFDEIDLSYLVTELDNLEIEMPFSEQEILDFKNMAEFNFDYDEKEPTSDELDDQMVSYSVKMTPGQLEVFKRAVDIIKEDADCSDGRACELLAAEYISGYNVENSKEEEKA